MQAYVCPLAQLNKYWSDFLGFLHRIGCTPGSVLFDVGPDRNPDPDFNQVTDYEMSVVALCLFVVQTPY